MLWLKLDAGLVACGDPQLFSVGLEEGQLVDNKL